MEWVSLPCANTPPRNSHAAVLDGETMIIIGGASPEGQADEVFTIDMSNRSDLTCRRVSCQPLEPSTGEARSPDGLGALPTAREMHSACAYDSKGNGGARATTILVMGGRSAKGVLRDLLALDTGARRGNSSLRMDHKRHGFKDREMRPTSNCFFLHVFLLDTLLSTTSHLEGFTELCTSVYTESIPIVLSCCLRSESVHWTQCLKPFLVFRPT